MGMGLSVGCSTVLMVIGGVLDFLNKLQSQCNYFGLGIYRSKSNIDTSTI